VTTYTIEVGHTGIPNGLATLAKALPDTSTLKVGDKVILNFGRDYVYLSTLALLATWRKSLAPGVTVKVDDHLSSVATQGMITNSGFREIIDTGHETPSVQKRLGKLPLRPLTNRLNKDAVVQDISSILSDNTSLIGDIKPLTTILSEICENALTHSGFASPGYVCATVTENEQKRRIEIAICDSGMGFRESYLNGTNEEVKARIERGASPIEIALEGLNSSKPIATPSSVVSYFGFGLYITRRLVEENRGQLFILSQGDGMNLNNRARNNIDLQKRYPGTLVVIILDLDNPLPLEEIYDQAVQNYVEPTSQPTTTDLAMPQSSNDQINAAHEDSANVSLDNQAKPKTDPAIIELRHFGTELLTRETGLAIRAELATQALIRGAVVVDLDGISDITPSVADEAFGKLAEKLGLETFERTVTFRGGTSLATRLIDFVMKTRIK